MNEESVIVCLCGSTRFRDVFARANFDETLQGKIVLTIGCDFKSPEARARRLTQADKERLDALHLRKIDLADEILVLNVGDYIGDSTHYEIAYALQQGKRVRFLELHEGVTEYKPPQDVEWDGDVDGDDQVLAESCLRCGRATIGMCQFCALPLCASCDERYGSCGCMER